MTLWLDIMQFLGGRDMTGTSLGFWHTKGPRRDSFPVSWEKTRGSSATNGVETHLSTPLLKRIDSPKRPSYWGHMPANEILRLKIASQDQISIPPNFSGLFKAGSLWWLPWWQKPWKKVDFDLSIHGFKSMQRGEHFPPKSEDPKRLR